MLMSYTYHKTAVLLVPIMWKKYKKQILLALPPCLLLSGILGFWGAGQLASAQLSKLESALLRSSFEEDTLSLHFTLCEPGKWGLADLDASLPLYTKNTFAEAAALLQTQAKKADRIPEVFLSKEDALRLHLFRDYLESSEKSLEFPYYAEPLSPSSGAQSQFPVLMAEFPFRTKADVEHYLALLDQTDEYFDGLIAYEQEKAKAGLFMSDESAKEVIEQCTLIPDSSRFADGSHFLCQTFSERLDALLAAGTITEAEKQHYLLENDRILTTVVVPAYDKLADSVFLLMGERSETTGLAAFPDGKAYYEYVTAEATGSAKTIPELKQMLTARLKEDFHALAALSATKQNALSLETLSAQAANLLPSTPEEMLADLQAQMVAAFPPLALDGSPLDDSYIQCSVKPVSDSLEKYVSPAYYFTPPADNIRNNTIYINHSQTPQGLSLYTTLAHEGYPGHLYQSVFFQLTENAALPPVRSIYYYGGYVEGWALYVEMLSYDFAKNTMQAAGSSPDAASTGSSAMNAAGSDVNMPLIDFACTLQHLDRDMQLCLYSLLDIAIHYDGASKAEIEELLSGFGLSKETAGIIYRRIAEEPANYLKYFVGYLEILECRDYAKQVWGEAYSDKTFHTFFLETGPCDFETLKELVVEYGENKLK